MHKPGAVILTLRIRLPETPTDSLDGLGEWAAETLGDGLMMEGARYLGGALQKAGPQPRVSIHPTTYRGEAGYSVRSSAGSSIFTRTRPSAERLRERLRNGEDDRAEDYRL